ncbi:hypothetical protein RhiJN_28703 [Ceratobasidium sp. AG-Ba]|nr:hypothetical protein RhiJN_28703 [Ceratobasidium sp. AG-Ba]
MSQPPPPPEIHHSAPLPRRTAPLQPIGTPKFHRYVAIVSYSFVGAITIYNVFYADYGDKEHVFSPARRWLDRQKAAFWTLSPAEQATAERRTLDYFAGSEVSSYEAKTLRKDAEIARLGSSRVLVAEYRRSWDRLRYAPVGLMSERLFEANILA